MRSLVSFFLVIIAPSAAAQQARAIDTGLVRTMESKFVFPRQAYLLSDYKRVYASETENGRTIIRGMMFGPREPDEEKFLGRAAPVDGVPGAWVGKPGFQFPLMFDAGCEVLTVLYDPNAGAPQVDCTSGWAGEPDLKKN